MVKWNDPASGAPTTPTGNDYELVRDDRKSFVKLPKVGIGLEWGAVTTM